jgi:copper chaperone CopZ
MKKLILIAVIACCMASVQAQEVKQDETKTSQTKLNKNKQITFEVNGSCGMCKKRIEKAAYSVKGVKSATWSAEHQDLHLIIDETKCSVEDVQKAIAKAGHDTEGVQATDEAYEKIHGCCKYRENNDTHE